MSKIWQRMYKQIYDPRQMNRAGEITETWFWVILCMSILRQQKVRIYTYFWGLAHMILYLDDDGDLCGRAML